MSTAYAEARQGGYEIVHPLTEEELPGNKAPRATEILGEDFGYTGSVDQVRKPDAPAVHIHAHGRAGATALNLGQLAGPRRLGAGAPPWIAR